MRFQFQRWFFVLLGILAVVSRLDAQIPGISSKPAPAPAEEAAAEKPEESKARLELWLKETRAAFARVNEPGAEEQLPEGIDATALADYRRDLEQIIVGVNRHLKVLSELPQAHKALEAAREEDAAWNGFKEKPPFSILMIDELANQQESVREKAASYRSSLELFRRTLAGIQEEGRRGEESSRRIIADVAEDPADGGAAKWRLAADRTKSRLLALRATALQTTVSLLEDQAETARIQLSLLDRQIALAKGKASFSDEDLAKVKKAAADRQAALAKEIAATRKRLQDANVAKSRMQTTIDQLRKATPEDTPLEETPELALVTVKMEAAETRVDSLQFVLETLESLDQLESYVPDVYQSRKALMESKTKAIREPALQNLRTAFDRLKSWEVVVANSLAEINADISKQESRASAIPAEDPRLIPINSIRASLWEKQAVMQRVAQTLAVQRRMLQRWLEEFDATKVRRPLGETLAETAASTWESIKRIWNFEVFQYNDTVMIGGLPITEKRGVPLGKFFIGLIFFAIAYFLSSRMNLRLRNAVVRRGHIAEAQARTLGNWLMIVVGFLLAVGTLHFLKIPLTVFAFLGGALAIGIGFGTQTLIKNFISGIIVLFERKIRVGDVVDIGGTAGSVVEINTRSSVVRSPDGREALVPNSVFLENTVTNLTLSNRTLRRFINVGVSYGTSPQQVIAILTECAERHGLVHKDPAPLVVFVDFGDNALLFRLYVWVALEGKNNPELVESDLRLMIEKRFGEAGIGFPFPQRDMHLRTGAPLQIEWTPPAAPADER